MRSRILFLSGRREDARELLEMLHSLPVVLDHAETLRQARVRLERDEYDIVLTEAALPDGNWLDVLHLVRDCPGQLPVVVTDAQADNRVWAQALNLGAYDWLAQPFYEPEVRRIVSNACTHAVPVLSAL